jgi:hypothetical protein
MDTRAHAGPWGRGGYQAPPLLPGCEVEGSWGEEDQATLQAENRKYASLFAGPGVNVADLALGETGKILKETVAFGLLTGAWKGLCHEIF